MDTSYHSVRMHASRDGRHLSGAEDLVPKAAVEAVAQAMLRRALAHAPQSLSLIVEPVAASDLVFGSLPDVVLAPVADVASGRQRALNALVQAGVTPFAAKVAIATIAAGAAPDGGVMRGAMLIDARTGQRLEADAARGVRATRLGVSATAKAACETLLATHGLGHHRTREALCLAAKVMATPGVIAELCWSDDPGYTAGYVASQRDGYLRIAQLKELGDPRGGRAFFLAGGSDPATVTGFLEQTPFLACAVGTLRQEEC